MRVPWGLVSQVLASGTNFLVLMNLARLQDARSFGWSAVIVALITASVGVTRSVLGTHLALAAHSSEGLSRETRFAVTAGAVAVLPLVIPGLAWSALTTDSLILSACMAAPLVVVNDVFRQAAVSSRRSGLAAGGDAWRFVVGLLVLALSLELSPRPWLVLTCWGLAAGVASWWIGRRIGWRPQRGGLRAHLALSWRSRRALLADSALVQATPVLTSLTVGALLGPVALSAFRGSSTMLGPISIFLTAIPLLMLPRLVHQGVDSPAPAMRQMGPVVLVLSFACIGVAAVTPFIPQTAGEVVLGDSWQATATVLPIMALQFALQPWGTMASTVLKLVGRERLLIPLRVTLSTSILICVGVVSIFGSLVAVVMVVLVVELIMTAVYVHTARRATPSATRPLSPHVRTTDA